MTTTIRVVAAVDVAMRNVLLGTSAGGDHLNQGLSEAVATAHPGYTIDLAIHDSQSLADVGSLVGPDVDVVVIATGAEAAGLGQLAHVPAEAVAAFHDDVVAAVDSIKDISGAHVLIANVSTFDPEDETSSLHGLAEEPISMRAHRINLALLQLSHEIGISIIDVDRITAEAGCGTVVPKALELTAAGSALVRDETLRILADYGFFDERSLVAQVGNRGGGR